MDATLATAIISGVTAALASYSLAPLLFKGDKIVLARELKRERELGSDTRKRLEAENDRLRHDLATTQAELKQQFQAQAELAQQVFDATRFLQGLANLAAQERRRDPR
jgi:hypothetical protein